MKSAFQIQQLRMALNMSQLELAHKLGYKSGSAIGMWETGARNPPSLILPQLAEALDCSIDDLFATANLPPNEQDSA